MTDGPISGRYRAGQHPSPATEFKPGSTIGAAYRFKPGQPARNKLPIGSVRVRIETHTRSPRAWVKVAEPNIWRKRAIVVWEASNGPVRRGLIVHHKDRDSLNDDPSNLVALTRKEHTKEHHKELVAAMAKAVLGPNWPQPRAPSITPGDTPMTSEVSMTALAAKTHPDSPAAEDLRALKRIHRDQWEAKIRAAMRNADGYPHKAAELLDVSVRTMFRILDDPAFVNIERASPGNPDFGEGYERPKRRRRKH